MGLDGLIVHSPYTMSHTFPHSLEKEKLESKILESMSHPFIVHLYKAVGSGKWGQSVDPKGRMASHSVLHEVWGGNQ